MDAYRWVTNAGMAGVVVFMGLGVVGMTGFTIEGDTNTGVITTVECSNAQTQGGQLNCGVSGNPHDEDVAEAPPEEEE